jgi:type IV pilus assembly protein PilO
MSANIAPRPKATTINVRQVRERAQEWLSPVNLHWAGVGVLGLVCLYLLVQMGIAWQLAKSQDAAALADQRQQLAVAKVQAKPLQGLDGKLHTANVSADKFYHERLPVSYSEMLAELGALKTKANVRLTRAQYAQKPVPNDTAGQLTEVNMDTSLSGDYRPLMLFINGLERDKLFFVIEQLTLTGQQTGQVNLRLHMTTYMRGTPSDEERQAAEVGTGPETPAADIDKSIESAQHRPGGSR